jgi:predicted kinase
VPDRPAPEVAVLVGLPASGKTSFHRDRLAATHAHVSRDLLPRGSGARAQERAVVDALAAGRSVAVDNTHPRRADRAPLIALARRHGARVVAYVFAPDTRGSLARNRARAGDARVPAVAIFTAAKRFEPPSRAEGFDEIYAVELVPPSGFRVAGYAEPA